jgi:acyl dehydratase
MNVLEPQSFPPVTAEMLKAYAAASGDSNPIHLDPEAARRAGLPGPIAHGMLVSAWLAERAERFASGEPGLDGMRIVEFTSRFRAMVLLGDVISIGGNSKETPDGGVTLELQARNQRGEVTTTGQAKFARPTSG